MAGIGIKLNKVFERKSISGMAYGAGYSVITTIAPMILVISNIWLMQYVLGFNDAGYNDKQVFQATILYIFIFSMIVTSILNAALSRYLSDVIFEEKYEEIRAAFRVGFVADMLFAVIPGICFAVKECIVGQIPVYYVFISFACFISLVIVLYTTSYLSICKDYKRISWFYFAGMAVAFIVAVFLAKVCEVEVTTAILSGLTTGFIIIAALAYALVKHYFTQVSRDYKAVIVYLLRRWKLILANLLYTLGLFVHNFVFWHSPLKTVIADTFVCAETYDFASCLAMFTNISASVIFIVLVETQFNGRYKQYSEAVIGGRLIDIEKTKTRMFRLLSEQIISIVRIQFIISTVLFLVTLFFLQKNGYAGNVIQLYPCMAAGYFILFIMYSVFLYLYYYNDYNGALMTGLIFFIVTMVGSIVCMNFDTIWYAAGLVCGAFAGWTYGYFRLRKMERDIDMHIFCNGTILRQIKGKRPAGKVYDMEEMLKQQNVEN